MCEKSLCIPNDGNAVIAYKDRTGKLHLSEREVYEAHNKYDKERYTSLIHSYYNANYYNSYSRKNIDSSFLNNLSLTTLRSMCIDLKVLSQ